MPFFKELRRRKTSSKSENSLPTASAPSTESNGTVPTTKSSSTLSSFYGSNTTLTPASSIQPSHSNPNLTLTINKPGTATNPIPQRPVALGTAMAGNRNSVAVRSCHLPSPPSNSRERTKLMYLGQVLSTMQSFNSGPVPKPPAPTFAPRILSITDNSW
ncbi:MAG: hypothetical protein Q9204_006988, partial [Flavoplaca sp. TL-2023a]